MPELPEVETVRRTLVRNLPGHRIIGVEVRRDSVIHGPSRPADLLAGLSIGQIRRHGKQLAILATEPAGKKALQARKCVCIHLGMTGSLRYAQGDPPGDSPEDSHCHVIWHLDGGAHFWFRDPRRFGGLWTFSSPDALAEQRWSRLGPDALLIKPKELHARLSLTRRAIKAALLDQHVLAGLGNIYVDECLYACRINPNFPACQLQLKQVQLMIRCMRRLLTKAIAAGGSSLRDYVDSDGRQGQFQQQHLVYGRAGLRCRNCHAILTKIVLAGRTTVFCPDCQPEPNGVSC